MSRRLTIESLDKNLKYILIIPALSILLFFSIFPTVYNLYLSLTDATIFNYRSPKFIWFNNYCSILITSNYFWESMKVTLLFISIVIPAEMCLGIAYALLVNNLASTKLRRVITSLILLPLAIAPVFVGALSKLLFHNLVGVVSYYMRLVGLEPFLLSNPSHALLVIAIMDIWQWTPFVFIIILAGLMSLPQGVLEAAKVDGASGLKELRYITLPMLKKVIFTALIFRLMDALRAFDVPFVLLEGGPGAPVGATTTISILIYKMSLTYNKFGVSAALSVLFLIVLSILLTTIIRQVWKDLYG